TRDRAREREREPAPHSVLVLVAELREDAEILERRGIALRLERARGDLLQEAPHDLPAARLGERIGEADLIRPCELADLFVDVRGELVLQILARDLSALQRDERDEGL